MTLKEEGQLIDLSQRPVKTLGCYHSGIWGLKGGRDLKILNHKILGLCRIQGVADFSALAAERTSSFVNTAKRKGCDSRK
jgi:hypothetical protein